VAEPTTSFGTLANELHAGLFGLREILDGAGGNLAHLRDAAKEIRGLTARRATGRQVASLSWQLTLNSMQDFAPTSAMAFRGLFRKRTLSRHLGSRSFGSDRPNPAGATQIVTRRENTAATAFSCRASRHISPMAAPRKTAPFKSRVIHGGLPKRTKNTATIEIVQTKFRKSHFAIDGRGLFTTAWGVL